MYRKVKDSHLQWPQLWHLAQKKKWKDVFSVHFWTELKSQNIDLMVRPQLLFSLGTFYSFLAGLYRNQVKPVQQSRQQVILVQSSTQRDLEPNFQHGFSVLGHLGRKGIFSQFCSSMYRTFKIISFYIFAGWTNKSVPAVSPLKSW